MYLISGEMVGITQKSSVDAFPLWSLQKQNGWVKKSENNVKDIIGISIACHVFIQGSDLAVTADF